MNIFLAGIIQGSKTGEDVHSQDWREGLARKDMIEKALRGLLGVQG